MNLQAFFSPQTIVFYVACCMGNKNLLYKIKTMGLIFVTKSCGGEVTKYRFKGFLKHTVLDNVPLFNVVQEKVIREQYYNQIVTAYHIWCSNFLGWVIMRRLLP